ncbi:MAG TPA: ribosome small subunit-dependent GTPase A [Frankiaceae bacterium]|nr:ribosome small subunit-dependent GTPase A [Frankiaceae bacterium]
MSRRELDEDDVRSRPGPGSRPRTRTRPKHADAVVGVVVTFDRGRFTCLLDGREVVAMRGGEVRRTPLVVGDRVRIVGDTSGNPGALARIVGLEPRTSVLHRTADDTDPVERPIVANADQVVIVVAVADPPPRSRLIDRCLVAAFDAGLEPLLCLTKNDLADPGELLEFYEPLGVRAVTTGRDASLAAIRAALHDRVSVLVGHSGVGKSTLVNQLVPDAFRRTADVSGVGKGRHTSVTAIALPLPDGGWVVDTPGIRSFGLGHVTPDSVLRAFPDLAPGAEECLPNCDHAEGADHCGVAERVADEHATAARLASYRRLLSARGGEDET